MNTGVLQDSSGREHRAWTGRALPPMGYCLHSAFHSRLNVLGILFFSRVQINSINKALPIVIRISKSLVGYQYNYER